MSPRSTEDAPIVEVQNYNIFATEPANRRATTVLRPIEKTAIRNISESTNSRGASVTLVPMAAASETFVHLYTGKWNRIKTGVQTTLG